MVSRVRFHKYGFFPEWVYDELSDSRVVSGVVRYVMRRGWVIRRPKTVAGVIGSIVGWRYPVYAGMWSDYERYGYVVWPVVLSRNVGLTLSVAHAIVDVLGVDMIDDRDVARVVRSAGRSGYFMFPNGVVARVRRPSARELRGRYLRLLAKLVVPRPLDSLGASGNSEVPYLRSGGFVEYFREGGRTWVVVRKDRVFEVVEAVRERLNKTVVFLLDTVIEGYEIIKNERYVYKADYNKLMALVRGARKLLDIIDRWLEIPFAVDKEFIETAVEAGRLFVEDPFRVTDFVDELGVSGASAVG